MAPMPYVIEVVFYQSDEATYVVQGTEATFTNENNGETVSEEIGANGVCIFDLANFTSGWTNGDIISFTVGGNATRGKYIKLKAIAHNTAQLKYLKCKIEEET